MITATTVLAPTESRARRAPPAGDSLFGTTRVLLLMFALLTAVAFNQLFVLSAHTDSWFSWTIRPPLTAAFLGASYAAGNVMVLLALRARSWTRARLPVITVLIFAVLTLVATVAHLEKFHFGSPEVVARFAAWFWLVIYVLVPIALAATVVRQQRATPSHLPRGRPLPGWLTVALAVQGVVLVAAGGMLFIDPSGTSWLWPWPLTPLTSMIVAAWLAAFGATALIGCWESDLDRLHISFVGYAVLGSLQLLALALHSDQMAWGTANAWWYLGIVAVALATGLGGRRLSSRRREFIRPHPS